MSTARRLNYSYAEYLDTLRLSEVRLEYLQGEIFAMAGGTPEHGMLAARLIQLLGACLPATCRVMTSDVRIRVPATGLSTFPDVSVVCGQLERAPDDVNAIINPTLLVEILSPSTEAYDRGEKLRHYQQLPSLQLVLLVAHDAHDAHDARRVTAVRRGSSAWTSSELEPGQAIDLPSGGALSVAAIYGDQKKESAR